MKILKEIITEIDTTKLDYIENETNKNKIINWAKRMNENIKSTSLKELFKGYYKTITPMVWIIFFTTMFLYLGVIFTVPLTMIEVD